MLQSWLSQEKNHASYSWFIEKKKEKKKEEECENFQGREIGVLCELEYIVMEILYLVMKGSFLGFQRR